MANEIYDTPIVVDNGSGFIKAGLAGDSEPTSIFSSLIGIPKHRRIMHIDKEKENYVGKEAQEKRGILFLKYTCENGIISNWDNVEKVWDHLFQHELSVNPENHPILMTEPCYNQRMNKIKMAEIIFENFQVPAFCLVLPAVLSLFASGKTSGLMIDSGDIFTQIIPIYEGYLLHRGIQKALLSGRNITEFLGRIFLERGWSFSTTAEREILREIKENLSYVSSDFEKEIRIRDSAQKPQPYILPDGKVIYLGTERFRCSEILFQPYMIGSELEGIHRRVFNSIMTCDLDIRRIMFSNIILSGGTTMTKGFEYRLQEEIKKITKSRIPVEVLAPLQRRYSAWLGGSMIASTPTYNDIWISRDEYYEYGPSVVLKKRP